MSKEYKTKSMIMVNPEKIAFRDTDDFLGTIFYMKNAESLKNYAKEILDLIIKEGIICTDSKAVIAKIDPTEKIVTERVYYNILRRFKALGMIKKEKGVYTPSDRFGLTLRRIADYYDALKKLDKVK